MLYSKTGFKRVFLRFLVYKNKSESKILVGSQKQKSTLNKLEWYIILEFGIHFFSRYMKNTM